MGLLKDGSRPGCNCVWCFASTILPDDGTSTKFVKSLTDENGTFRDKNVGQRLQGPYKAPILIAMFIKWKDAQDA